jgi:hypothetical protein
MRARPGIQSVFSAAVVWSVFACARPSQAPAIARSLDRASELAGCWELLAWPEHIDLPIQITTVVSLDSVPVSGTSSLGLRGAVIEPVQNFPLSTPVLWTVEANPDTLVISIGVPAKQLYRLDRADSVWDGVAYSSGSAIARERFFPARGRQVPCSKAT